MVASSRLMWHMLNTENWACATEAEMMKPSTVAEVVPPKRIRERLRKMQWFFDEKNIEERKP